MTALLQPLTRRRVNMVYLGLMRQGFSPEQIRMMEFVKYLISKGVYEG